MSLKITGEDENVIVIEGNVSGELRDQDHSIRVTVITGGTIIDVLVPRARSEGLLKSGITQGWRVRTRGQVVGRKRKDGGVTLEMKTDQIVYEPPKKKYVVQRKEIHVQPIEVFAHSPEEARQMVADGVEGDTDLPVRKPPTRRCTARSYTTMGDRRLMLGTHMGSTSRTQRARSGLLTISYSTVSGSTFTGMVPVRLVS